MTKGNSAWEKATAGTYVDGHMPRTALVAILVVALVVVAIPSVGMLWARTDSTTENRELAAAPSFTDDDGSFNWDVLDDAGTYFADHFAYRNQLVAANARLQAAFGASATDQVVVGNDGWLYYGGTLPDYLGQSALPDRALRNIAHNLALAQGYVESQGATFSFTLAPNKNTLYPEHMPYYYVAADEPSNAERLKPLLEEAGVNYVDLFDLFEGLEGEWYLKKDSHWDNRGALMATQKLLDAADRDALSLDVADAEPRVDFAGDLESMLYPSGADLDQNWYFDGVDDDAGMSGSSWRYVQGEDVTESWVVTNAAAGKGSLLMFRDSFGNALLPLFASTYGQGVFSKLVPYNLPTMVECQADTVIVERAERHVSYLAENPPIMPNPTVQLDAALPSGDGEPRATLNVEENGPYWMVSGVVDDGILEDDARIYVSVERSGAKVDVYDAFWTSISDGEGGYASNSGFLVYLDKGAVDLASATVRVYCVSNGVFTCLGTFDDL